MKTLGIRNSGEILGTPDFVQQVVLASGTSNAAAFDTPAGAGYVAFAFTNNIYVKYGSTAATTPSATSTNSSAAELNPTVRNIGSSLATTGISLCADVACNGSLSWFSKP